MAEGCLISLLPENNSPAYAPGCCRECDPTVELLAASFANKARSFLQQERITKATKPVAPFFS
jgi:hypothetical protein